MSCPYCGSADVRRSHTSYGLDHLGLHLCRCRACGERFWRGTRQVEAQRARRAHYFEAPEAPSGSDAADLGPLDHDVVRRRAPSRPH